jgi:hypothetical protein
VTSDRRHVAAGTRTLHEFRRIVRDRSAAPHGIPKAHPLAATIYADFESQMHTLIRAALQGAGIARKGASDMFFAAAIGSLKTGDIAERPYRTRLGALVDTLMLGLKTPS